PPATYRKPVRRAKGKNRAPKKRAKTLRRLANINMSRWASRQAQRNYKQVRPLAPDDETARRALIDLNYRLNNPLEAVKELDSLLRMYAQQRRGDQIISTLEQMVQGTPNDMALRSRLAPVYKHTNRKDDAVCQLDAL